MNGWLDPRLPCREIRPARVYAATENDKDDSIAFNVVPSVTSVLLVTRSLMTFGFL